MSDTHSDSRAGLLASLVRKEHSNLPVGAWGFFFPVVLAVWRFLNITHPGALGEVHPRWADRSAAVPTEVEVSGDSYLIRHTAALSFDPTEGPVLLGPGGSWIAEEMSSGPLLDAVESLAYAVSGSIAQSLPRGGVLRLEQIPPPDRALVVEVARVAGERLELRGAPA